MFLPEIGEKIKRFKCTDAYEFFKTNTGNIEINIGNELNTVYFPVQPVTTFLTEATKDRFSREVSRESN
jgi:hypothetical protein